MKATERTRIFRLTVQAWVITLVVLVTELSSTTSGDTGGLHLGGLCLLVSTVLTLVAAAR